MTRCFFSPLVFALAGFLAAGRPLYADTTNTAPAGAIILENNVAYLRADRSGSYPMTTNIIIGTILDLRSADGDGSPATNVFSGRKSPLVILVNGQTRGAAAALAAQLHTAAAIVIGSTNPPGIITPDIAVDVSADDEKNFMANPYFTAPAAVAAANDLLPFVDHMTEAELVRKRVKDGDDPGGPPSPRAEPPPVIRDPALARAVDLLKALAVLHPARG